jgi:hypothetical protein
VQAILAACAAALYRAARPDRKASRAGAPPAAPASAAG